MGSTVTPQYLDDSGNPISQSSQNYLDDNGNPVAPPTPATIKAAPAFMSIPWLKEKLYNTADSATNMLPALGAAAGGMAGATLGPVSAVGGAGLGGMAGEGGRQFVRSIIFPDEQPTMDQAARSIAKQGALQGGIEATGGLVGAGLNAIAPAMARTALRIPKSVETRGVNTGREILDNTTGYTPAKIAQVEKVRLGKLAEQQTDLAHQATGTINMRPSLDPVDHALAHTNNPENLRALNKARGVITTDLKTGQPASMDAHPVTALDTRRDIDDLIDTWQLRPESSRVRSATQGAYGHITGELHNNVPGLADTDLALSNAIPVHYYANRAANLKGIGENLLVPKGSSLTTAGAGLGYGASHTPEGAFLGAVGGRIIPEILMNPTARMALARGANSPMVKTIIQGGARAATLPALKKYGEK